MLEAKFGNDPWLSLGKRPVSHFTKSKDFVKISNKSDDNTNVDNQLFRQKYFELYIMLRPLSKFPTIAKLLYDAKRILTSVEPVHSAVSSRFFKWF